MFKLSLIRLVMGQMQICKPKGSWKCLLLPTGDSWCLLVECRNSFAGQTTVSSSPELCFDPVLPSCGFWPPTAMLTRLLTAPGGWLPCCLETLIGIMTEPCQCDWQVCTYSRLGHPRSTNDSSQTSEDKKASGFGRLRRKKTGLGFSPWALGKQWGQSRVSIWCMMLPTFMKRRQRKMNRWTAMRKDMGGQYKGTGRRKIKSQSKKKEYYISHQRCLLWVSLFPPIPPFFRKEVTFVFQTVITSLSIRKNSLLSLHILRVDQISFLASSRVYHSC